MRQRPKYQQGKFIKDSELLSFDPKLTIDLVDDSSISETYKSVYRNWILSSKNNEVAGLNNYPHTSFSQGTTESFDKFYVRHAKRTFKVFKGEYTYHKVMFKSGLTWNYIDDFPLTQNDALIISLPFANTGGDYNYESILREAEKLNIPTLVDCCWFGSCGGLSFNFNYSCIEDITFSLSKAFPISRFRVGIRFSKEKHLEDGINAYEHDNYVNYFSQHLGVSYMNNFSCDYLFNKYRSQQSYLCSQLGVEPSSVVSLATSSDEKWNYLDRGMSNLYRLSLSDEFNV